MALFKILNNIDSKNALPANYVPGYCYFDVNTGKFYIDTTTDAPGRMVINAEKADKFRNPVKLKLAGDVYVVENDGFITFDGSEFDGSETDEGITYKIGIKTDSHSHTYLDPRQAFGSQDLNNYTTSFFATYYGGGSNTVVNKPNGVTGFGLLCYPIGSVYKSQELLSSNGIKYIRYYNDATWSEWKQIAYITDNVASADKLKNARKLKLQGEVTSNEVSFDGSSDIALSTIIGTVTSPIDSSLSGGTYLQGNRGNAIINSTASAGTCVHLAKTNSTNGYFCITSYQRALLLSYTAKSTVDAGTNAVTKQVTLLDENGNSIFPGTVYATAFNGNATTASKLATSRTITLTGDAEGSVSFDGSNNVELDVTVKDNSHWHYYTKIYDNHIEAPSDGSETAPHFGMQQSSGFYVTKTYDDSNVPVRLGNILNVAGGGDGQLLLEWRGSNTDNAPGHLYYRSHRNLNAPWSNWGKIAFVTDNVASASKVKNALTVKVTNVANAVTTTAFDGSAAKTININATDFMPLFSFSKELTLTTEWQDTGISGNDIPNTGSYIIQVFVNATSTLNNYNEYYTGFMSWSSAGTNSNDADEIILHKAGHASNGKYIYLRTVRTPAVGSTQGSLKLQIAANVDTTAISTLQFKVRQLI